jgi:hypothetical protein
MLYNLRGILLLVLTTVVLQPFSVGAVNLKSFNAGESQISADVEILGRYEYWNWFSAQTSADNNYGYFFTRTRIGLRYTSELIHAYVQAQNTAMLGLPDNATAPAPAGPLGIGSIYYLHDHEENSQSTIIRQAFLELPDIAGSGVFIKGGRFDYLDGKEVMYQNPKVNWLKNIRLSEKLIGPFGWAAYCRSFDGLQFSYDRPTVNLTTMASHPTEGGFTDRAHNTMNDIDLATVTATVKYDTLIPNAEGRLFYYYYDDKRDIAKADNTEAGSSKNQGNISINSFGMHLLTIKKTKSGIFDALIWGAYQDGDWGSLDHEAWAYSIEAGYQLTGIYSKPWLRVGYSASSGDDDPGDHNHGTFYQLLPTARKYALFPFYNMMNSRDLFAQIIAKPHHKLALRGDLHLLSLSEDDDRWYMGAGPTQNDGPVFGYIGRPSFGDRDLATVLELTAIMNISKHVVATAYYAHAFGNDVVSNVYTEDDDADFCYFELKFVL